MAVRVALLSPDGRLQGSYSAPSLATAQAEADPAGTVLIVADNFKLDARDGWRWDGAAWQPYPFPPPPVVLSTDDVLNLLKSKGLITQKDIDDAKAAKAPKP